jgi:hypothetical protein
LDIRLEPEIRFPARHILVTLFGFAIPEPIVQQIDIGGHFDGLISISLMIFWALAVSVIVWVAVVSK